MELMPIFRTNRPRRLDQLLRQEGYQQYRIDILVKCGGIYLSHLGKLTKVNDPNTRVQVGDLVSVADDLPKECQQALNNIPPNVFRDYAFAPGRTNFDRRMREVLQFRHQTIVIQGPLINTLSDFIRALGTSPRITNPIRNLIIASHSNPEGQLQMDLAVGVSGFISYEDLENARASGIINIKPILLEPRPKVQGGQPELAALQVKGCRIGKTKPFLLALKNALGGGLLVKAPKHFHLGAIHHRPNGRVEYMAYGFNLNLQNRLRNRDQAVRAFSNGGFKYIDDSPVSARDWQTWIPSRWVPRNARNHRHTMGPRVVDPVTNSQITAYGEFRYRRRNLFDQRQTLSLDADPGGYDANKKAVRDALMSVHARYRDSHPFPEYVRFGYTSMNAFMDGWYWMFVWEQANKMLSYQATRHEYTMIRPIVDRGTNRLFMNFFPAAGVRADPLIQIREDDSRFYETV